MVVENREIETVKGRIAENIADGASVYTDSWKSYNCLSDNHEDWILDHKVGQYVNGDVSTNGMQSYWTILKRAYHGTYTHIIDQHAGKYLAEEDFRFNTW